VSNVLGLGLVFSHNGMLEENLRKGVWKCTLRVGHLDLQLQIYRELYLQGMWCNSD